MIFDLAPDSHENSFALEPPRKLHISKKQIAPRVVVSESANGGGVCAMGLEGLGPGLEVGARYTGKLTQEETELSIQSHSFFRDWI